MSIDEEVEKTVRRILKDDKYRTESQIKETVTLIVEDFHSKFDAELRVQTEEIEKLRVSHDRLWDIMKNPLPKDSWWNRFKTYFTFGRM